MLIILKTFKKIQKKKKYGRSQHNIMKQLSSN